MHKLVAELQAKYVDEPTYQVLDRVFKEHFVSDENTLRAKKGKELSADSLQSPDDWEATYRRKRNEDYQGYVANLTETCDPKNKFQLINKRRAFALQGLQAGICMDCRIKTFT